MPDLADLALRAAVDIAAILVLAGGLYLRRHRRPDLFVVLALFNLGLFAAVAVLARADVSIGVGFGLFAVLSIVRLRSETFSPIELGYFFLALVLALVCAIDVGSPLAAAGLAGGLVLAAALIDHPRIVARERRVEATLELIFADDDALRRHLEERLHVRIAEVAILEVDFVRETTRVSLRCVDRPAPVRSPEVLGAA